MSTNETQSEEHRERLKSTTADLERLHLQFIALSHEMQQVHRGIALPPLPRAKEDVLRFLYDRALDESREMMNKGPYTSTFECVLGPNAEIIFVWMLQV